MQRRDLLSASLDAILATLIAIAGVGCLTSGLGLWTDMTAVVLTAAVFALLSVLFSRLRRGWIWLLATLALGAQLLWWLDFGDAFYPQLKTALSFYHQAYGWGVPQWLEDYDPCDATLVACVVAGGAALLGGISLQKNRYPGILLALIVPVIPVIVVTNTPPDALYIFLGFLVMGVLTLSWNSRRGDARQGNRLLALVLIPVMLASILLFSRNPQAEYVAPGREEGVFQLMYKLSEYLPFMHLTPGGNGPIPSNDASDAVDLMAAGPRDFAEVKVMEVESSYSGVIYLRGCSYDGYTGLQWTASPGKEALFVPTPDYLAGGVYTLRLQTQTRQALQYIPYYLRNVTLESGLVPNDSEKPFTYGFLPLRLDWKLLWRKSYGEMTRAQMTEYAEQMGLSRYLLLPETTAQQMQKYLRQAGVTGQEQLVQETVERIRAYVQNSADYDIGTAYLPQGTTDFALWFLAQGETGYCVHFATAATVLLRAAGIPARYVTGYLTETKAGEKSVVTSSDAHAWVEYYLPGVGWVILEATPEGGLSVTFPPEPTVPPETKPTEPTEPPETKPTEPTEPTEPTVPTRPTAPSAPTKPTVPSKPTQPSATAPEATTMPTEPGPSPDGDDTPRDWSGLWKLLQWIGIGVAVLGLGIVQWRLRLTLRRKKMQGAAWPQVRARWRYACRLAKLCGHKPPPVLETLAKKAKFSQHTLTERELRQFDRYGAACIRGLQRQPWPARVLCRLVLALW